LNVRKYWGFLKQWYKLIIILSLVVGSGVYIINKLTVPTYKATTTILINQARTTNSSQDYSALLAIDRLAKTYRELLLQRVVLEKVISDTAPGFSVDRLAKNIIVEVVRDTQLISLSVEDTNPKRAMLFANAIVKEFMVQNQFRQANRYTATKQSLQEELNKIQEEITKTQSAVDNLKIGETDQLTEQTRLQTLLAQYRNSYSNLLKSYEDVRLEEARSSDSIDIIDEASLPQAPIRPNVSLSTLMGTLVGLLGAISIALFIEYLDDSVKSPEQIEQLTGVSVLSLISLGKKQARINKPLALVQPYSPALEAYGILKANLEMVELEKPAHTLMVASSNRQEGTTTTAVNLAVTIAQSGKEVILVDTDLRQPNLHTWFNQPNDKGITNLLLDPTAKIEDYLIPTDVPGLSLLPSGPLTTSPTELLSSKPMAALIEQLKGHANVIILDGSALLPVLTSSLLTRYCDATILVVKIGSTRTSDLKKVCSRLGQSSVRLLGVVLNQVSKASLR